MLNINKITDCLNPHTAVLFSLTEIFTCTVLQLGKDPVLAQGSEEEEEEREMGTRV